MTFLPDESVMIPVFWQTLCFQCMSPISIIPNYKLVFVIHNSTNDRTNVWLTFSLSCCFEAHNLKKE